MKIEERRDVEAKTQGLKDICAQAWNHIAHQLYGSKRYIRDLHSKYSWNLEGQKEL